MFTTQDKLPDTLRNLYPFESNHIALSSGKMHYVDEGKGAPVLMLHGNPTWSFFYRSIIKHLSPQYRCIVPDHLGCGLSDLPINYNYTLSERISDIETLLKSLKIERFHLIVHDWGGAIGMGVATQRPDSILSITVLNTAAFPSQFIPSRINLCKLPVIGRFIVCQLNGFAGAATWMATVNRLPKEVRDAYLFPYQTPPCREAVYRFVEDIPMKQSHVSWECLSQIDKSLHLLNKTPMLIQWGAKDFCFNDHFLKGWQKRFPDAELDYYNDVGHYITEDAQNELPFRIGDFLKKTKS